MAAKTSATEASELEELFTGYGLVEGPRVDSEDRLYFSDARDGGVYCRAPGGEIETLIPKRRGVGGIALHASGGVVVSGKNICHVRDGVSRILFGQDDIPGFNDLFTDTQGRILVGSQRFNPFEENVETVPGEMYRIGPEGKVEVLYGDVGLTNGIGFSPDGRRLYHCDSARNHVLVHDVTDDDRFENRRVFAEMPRGVCDGMAVDEQGRVWVAGFGAGAVVRFTPEGKVDGYLDVPATGVATLCFGGPDRRDLYVATADKSSASSKGGSVFRARARVPGLPVPLARV